MTSMALFGERSLTLVAATFSSPRDAVQAADQLRRQMPPTAGEVDVLRPGDADVAARLEPDQAGIWHTLLRTHAILGVVGMALGLVVAGALIKTAWPGATSSPGLVTLFSAVMGAFAGMLVAGVLTLRPDRVRVIRRVEQALTEGQVAVVAHPTDEATAGTATVALRRAGGDVIRSI